MELAPLAVWAGANDPQDPDGVQLQSTPEAELSFETVAATDAVPPGFIAVGGAATIVTDIAAGVFVVESLAEPTAPHPEKLTTKRRIVISARSVAVSELRLKSTGLSIDGILFALLRALLSLGDTCLRDKNEPMPCLRTIREKLEEVGGLKRRKTRRAGNRCPACVDPFSNSPSCGTPPRLCYIR